MKYKDYLTLLTILWLLSACSSEPTERAHSADYQSLKEGFLEPPNEARPKVYWWWLNGYVDTVRMIEELHAIKEAGIGGVDIFEIGTARYSNPDNMIPAGPAFMGEESLRSIQLAIEEAGKLGLEVGLNLASSWNAGGTWIQPEHAAKSLYFSKTTVSSAGSQEISLPFPEISPTDKNGKKRLIEFTEEGRPVYYEEVAVLAIPANKNNFSDTTGIINLSANFNTETEKLVWEVPEGSWDIYRYVCSNSGEQLKLPSPQSMAPIIDHYDSAATRAHFMHFINKLQPLLGDLEESALKNFYLASYEATGSVWTSSLPQVFEEIHGYPIDKFIPALFDDQFLDAEVARQFQQDFNKTLSQLITQNHYGKAREICNTYGLKITSESGGPGAPLHNVPVDALKALGTLDVPRGEFWVNHHNYAEDSVDILWLVKEIAAASHIYQRSMVEEEAFTSFQHWQEGPFDLKPLANKAFTEGMNRVVVHGFSHNPEGMGYPGVVYHAGTHYNDKRVWWSKIKPFNDYLARISFVLQQTDFVADVLYYYGDQVPNFIAPKNERFSVGQGYDYEVINTEILLNELSVKDGKLHLSNGATFKFLALGEDSRVNPAVMKKLRELTEAGALIIGTQPQTSVGLSSMPQAEEEVQRLAASIWKPMGENIDADALAQGGAFSGISPRQMLEKLQLPADFSYADAESGLLSYTHYQKGAMDFYLVSNTTNQWVSRQCIFRQEGKSPELWDPVSGEIIPVGIYQQNEEGISLPLSLPPYGAFLLVFSPQNTSPQYEQIQTAFGHPPHLRYLENGFELLEDAEVNLTQEGEAKAVKTTVKKEEIDGSWQLTFPANWGAPESATFPALTSWSESEEDGIRYFSGTATYHKTFRFSSAESENFDRIVLDLGKISEVGEVWLNDQPLGISWSAPHTFDLTDVLQEGENQLRIEVANTWSNRIVGDTKTGESYTRRNVSTAFRGTNWEDAPLLESGLLGPVQLIYTQVITDDTE